MPKQSEDELFAKLTSETDSHLWEYPLWLLGAAGATVLLYLYALPLFPSGARNIMMERGWFQPINTFLFLAGISLVIRAVLRCCKEKRCKVALDRVSDRIRQKWEPTLATQSTYAETFGKTQRNQGQDILDALQEDTGNIKGMFYKRIYRIGRYLKNTRAQNLAEMMDINRDLSSLDSETVLDRFMFVRYAVYLMPIIGFLGTVMGIGQAMGGISAALPAIQDLNGFVASLGGATASLQMAFDTTFLALVYSGLLTFVMTIGTWQNQGGLGFLDTWIIDNILSHVTEHNATESTMRSGFGLIAGNLNGTLYEDGLGGVHEKLEDIRKSIPRGGDDSSKIAKQLEDLTATVELIQKHQATGQDQRKAIKTLEAIKKAVPTKAAVDLEPVTTKLTAICEHSETIADSQQGIRDDINGLVAAVRNMPAFASKLDEAARGLSRLAEDLQSNQLENLASKLGDIADNTSKIEAVRGALCDVNQDGDELRAIQAFMQMEAAFETLMKAQVEKIAMEFNSAINEVSGVNTSLKNQVRDMSEQIQLLLKWIKDHK